MADELGKKQIQLKGRVLITCDIEAVTGLHIGGADVGVEIGGVDKTVVRNPITNRPYIPGSSLRGKMRSLLERYLGLVQNQSINNGYIHSCGALDKKDVDSYLKCPVCQVFGVPGEREFGTPTRLIVRDVQMSDDEADRITKTARTDLPFTEVKVEVAIDRVTSMANPRQLERVPGGVTFAGAELAYSIYDGAGCDAAADIERLDTVLRGLVLLEDDYLGGMGARGSGKVKIVNMSVSVRKDPLAEATSLIAGATLPAVVAAMAQIKADVRKNLGVA